MDRYRYRAAKPPRSTWSGIGIALGTVLCVAGLLYLGLMVYSYIALANFGSNK